VCQSHGPQLLSLYLATQQYNKMCSQSFGFCSPVLADCVANKSAASCASLAVQVGLVVCTAASDGVCGLTEFATAAQAGDLAAGGGLATLYRAVGPEELADIEGTGQYRPAPSGIGGKYFFPTKAQAENFQDLLAKSGQGSTCITSGCIPTSLLRGVDVIQPAGEGPAYFVPNELLPYFNNIIVHGP
jgi:hypothetical protein